MNENLFKLWGGRFSSTLDPIMEKFNASISFDQRLFQADIEASMAWARGLFKAQIITDQETELILKGLKEIQSEWSSGQFKILPSDEDIHTANDRRLKELIGPEVSGKLRTGRSRNDQVATDMKMWLRASIVELHNGLFQLFQLITERAAAEIEFIMPGYTHLQRAQPVLWSHWLLSFAWSFQADLMRLKGIHFRLNLCPLGCGAIAGNPFSIDREFVANELKFRAPTANSMHSVGDRDFIAEFHFWASLLAIHLTKLAEDIILFNSKEFNFVTLSDAYATGSSLMPQKKNPDSMELIRGKSGRVLGNLLSLLIVLKSLPSTFNKDTQEEKEAMFDTFDTLKNVIEIAKGTLSTLTVNQESLKAALSEDLLTTNVANYLVRKGMPFIQTHSLAGKVIAQSEAMNCPMSKLPLEEFQKISPLFEKDVYDVFNFRQTIQDYDCLGGTGTNSVLEQIRLLKEWAEKNLQI